MDQKIIDKLIDMSKADYGFIIDMDPTIVIPEVDITKYIQEYIKFSSTINTTMYIPEDPVNDANSGAFTNQTSAMYCIEGCPLFVSQSGLMSLHFDTSLVGVDFGPKVAVVAFIALQKKINIKILYKSERSRVNIPNCTPGGIESTKYDTFTLSNGSMIPTAVTIVNYGIGVNQTIGDYIKANPVLQNRMIKEGGMEKGAHLIPRYLIHQIMNDAITSEEFKSLAAQASCILSSFGVVDQDFDRICKIIGV